MKIGNYQWFPIIKPRSNLIQLKYFEDYRPFGDSSPSILEYQMIENR